MFMDEFFFSAGRFEYGQSSREGPDGALQPGVQGSNMVYYYEGGSSKVQMYTVDEKLLKEYVKRQM